MTIWLLIGVITFVAQVADAVICPRFQCAVWDSTQGTTCANETAVTGGGSIINVFDQMCTNGI
jgi:hypothetical protein